MSIIIPISSVGPRSSEIHDGHDSHWEGSSALHSQSSSHSDRAVRLYRDGLGYPAHVRVIGPAMHNVTQMEGIVEGDTV